MSNYNTLTFLETNLRRFRDASIDCYTLSLYFSLLNMYFQFVKLYAIF